MLREPSLTQSSSQHQAKHCYPTPAEVEQKAEQEQEQFLDYGKNRFLLNFGLIINFPADNQTCQEHAPGGQKVLGYL